MLVASPVGLTDTLSAASRGRRSDLRGSTLPISYVRSMSAGYLPDALAAVVFFGQAPDVPVPAARYSWTAVEHFLDRWGARHAGVAFSELGPDALGDLGGALERCRALGFRTGLHTRGYSPQPLKALLPLIDWVSLEVAASSSGRANVQISLQHLLESGADFECRLSLPNTRPDEEWVHREAQRLARFGVRNYVICTPHPERLLSGAEGLCRRLSALFPRFAVRTLH